MQKKDERPVDRHAETIVPSVAGDKQIHSATLLQACSKNVVFSQLQCLCFLDGALFTEASFRKA